MWHYLLVDQAIRDVVYIRGLQVAFDCGPRWEPWNDMPILSVHQIFFAYLWAILSGFDLAQDPIGHGQPLSVEVHVGVGL